HSLCLVFSIAVVPVARGILTVLLSVSVEERRANTSVRALRAPEGLGVGVVPLVVLQLVLVLRHESTFIAIQLLLCRYVSTSVPKPIFL
ncbi:hypothetical protein PMAYCL1PPCAC_03596, partial [Pristionchus mayeri]